MRTAIPFIASAFLLSALLSSSALLFASDPVSTIPATDPTGVGTRAAKELVSALNDCYTGTDAITTSTGRENWVGCPFRYGKPVRHGSACSCATVAPCDRIAANFERADCTSCNPAGTAGNAGDTCTSCNGCAPGAGCAPIPEFDECGLCPFCRRCEAHIDLYGHDLQYFCDQLEPKIRLLRPFEIYGGTFGRQAYARAYGYDCHSQRYRKYMPAAYISHEYVAAINRAVWEQLDADRAKWALEMAQIDAAHKQATKEVALGKVVEWQEYLEKMTALQDCCQIEVAEKWLEIAKESHCTATEEFQAAVWLVLEREEYLEFAVKRAKNSEKDAKIASHHQRVFVKPPIDREALRAGLPEKKAETEEN